MNLPVEAIPREIMVLAFICMWVDKQDSTWINMMLGPAWNIPYLWEFHSSIWETDTAFLLQDPVNMNAVCISQPSYNRTANGRNPIQKSIMSIMSIMLYYWDPPWQNLDMSCQRRWRSMQLNLTSKCHPNPYSPYFWNWMCEMIITVHGHSSLKPMQVGMSGFEAQGHGCISMKWHSVSFLLTEVTWRSALECSWNTNMELELYAPLPPSVQY